MDQRILTAISVGLALVAVGLFVVGPGVLGSGDTGEYNRTQVTVTDEDGTVRGTVDVRVADTAAQRRVGLSNTSSLGPDEGMLFVHDGVGRYAYYMPDMDFPLDIVFVAPNGTITTIHHASTPPPGVPDSELERYRGRGKYVLEVNRGWTNRTGTEVGDRVEIPEGY